MVALNLADRRYVYFCGDGKLYICISCSFSTWNNSTWKGTNRNGLQLAIYLRHHACLSLMVHWRPVIDFSLLGMNLSLTKPVQGQLGYYSRLQGTDQPAFPSWCWSKLKTKRWVLWGIIRIVGCLYSFSRTSIIRSIYLAWDDIMDIICTNILPCFAWSFQMPFR